MDKYLEAISGRLAQERKKLGLEQTEVCKIVDISIPTLSRYENGKRSPDLVLSKRLSELGYDIPYVITGKRLDESASDLTEDEMQWLELYRNSQRRAELVRLIKTYESME